MLFYFRSVDNFWKDTYKLRFLDIVNTYSSKIVMILAAHIHQADIRAPVSASYPDLSLSMLLTPSVSPIFMNNPGYTVLDLDLEVSGSSKP